MDLKTGRNLIKSAYNTRTHAHPTCTPPARYLARAPRRERFLLDFIRFLAKSPYNEVVARPSRLNHINIYEDMGYSHF